MYIVTFENGEENFHGPFTYIATHCMRGDKLIFECRKQQAGQTEFISVPVLFFNIITAEYLGK